MDNIEVATSSTTSRKLGESAMKIDEAVRQFREQISSPSSGAYKALRVFESSGDNRFSDPNYQEFGQKLFDNILNKVEESFKAVFPERI